jgi:hypothetical protein
MQRTSKQQRHLPNPSSTFEEARVRHQATAMRRWKRYATRGYGLKRMS